MAFPAFLKKGKKPKEGSAAEEAAESPAEEAAEKKSGKGDRPNPFAKKMRGGGSVKASWRTTNTTKGVKGYAKGGTVSIEATSAPTGTMRGTGAAVRGKGTRGVI